MAAPITSLVTSLTVSTPRLLTDHDPESKAYARYLWEKKYALKEVGPLSDSMFEILYAGTTGQTGPRLDRALAEVRSLGGTEALPESPRRNYSRDSDVDLLIVEDQPFGRGHGRRRELVHLWRLLARFPVAKDILVYSRDEVERWKGSLNHVIGRALREGRVLHARS